MVKQNKSDIPLYFWEISQKERKSSKKMNMQYLMKTVQKGTTLLFSNVSTLQNLLRTSSNNRGFHSLLRNITPSATLTKKTDVYFLTELLRPIEPLVKITCGLKYKCRLKLRCKDCYFCWDKGVLHVRCLTHGRHKQAQLKPKEKHTWILTSVCQKKQRPW